MADKTGIGWTNATWNPVRGCERVSEGCRNCYAEELAARHSYEGGWGSEVARYVTRPDGTRDARWTGVIETKEQQLKLPLKWKGPRMVFVNSMSDLFHDRVPFNFVDAIYEVMDRCSQHIYQILTKRPARMREYLTRRLEKFGLAPLPNVWHGVSAEDQATFDERTPPLLEAPSAVRWVSLEPLLGHIDLIGKDEQGSALHSYDGRPRLDWGVVGGESGSNFRPMDIEAARYIIRQFQGASVPLFVKQDNGPRPGMRGRFSDEEWALKQFPLTPAFATYGGQK